MNELLKTRFKLIMGYKGSGEGMLAMQRGEVEGHSTTWEAVKAVQPDWVPKGQVRVLVQHAINRHSELPAVPTSVGARGQSRQPRGDARDHGRERDRQVLFHHARRAAASASTHCAAPSTPP